MTVGELAQLFNTERGINADLHVVNVENWRRESWFDETSLVWINPSPNMRSLTEATLSSQPVFAVLEEGSHRSCKKNVRMFRTGLFPSLHHRKEGWPSDQYDVAKPPLIAAKRKRATAQPQERPGRFPMELKRKTTPAASASVASRNFFDDAATPPCGDARRGITPDSSFFTAL